MRVLCIHGGGSSASIFKSQTAAFRSKLDKSYIFDFVNAPHPSAPAPGLDVVFNSRHFVWYQQQTPALIRTAHKWIIDYIDQHGPYDAVCCFSQGCALIMTFLLYHARERPDEPLPFKAAVFICGSVPIPILEDLGLPVSRRAQEVSDRTAELLHETAGRLHHLAANPEQIRRGVGLWDNTGLLLHDPSVIPDESDVFGLDFTAIPADVRIKIPTVNIYGGKDPRWPSSMQLAHFCDDRTTFDHGGGHDIPRRTEVSNKIAALFRDLKSRLLRA